MAESTTSATPEPKTRLLDAADVLMYESGFEAVGVAELCRHAGVQKGSFYHFFGSKQELALAMLERSWQRTQSTIFAASILDQSLGGLAAIDRYGELLAQNLVNRAQPNGAVVGCRFGNFASELSNRNEQIRLHVNSVFDEMVALVATALERSQRAGELDRDLDTTSAATQVVALMEGLMVLAKARQDPNVLHRLGPVTRAMLAPNSY